MSADQAVARQNDPWTSWEAAKSVKGLEATRLRILGILKYLERPLSDEAIAEFYEDNARYQKWPDVSPSGLRSRRAELVTDGRVRAADGYGKTQSGRRCQLWEIALPTPQQQSML